MTTFGVAHADMVAASFVQSGEDVRQIRAVLAAAGAPHVQVFSKVENLAGLRNFAGILAESDGVMVARGDLGMDIPSAKVKPRSSSSSCALFPRAPFGPSPHLYIHIIFVSSPLPF